MRLSYSKLRTYQQCPLRYRFTYLDRLPRRPRRHFRAANRLHHALMTWLTYSRAQSASWQELETAYRRGWGPDGPEALQIRDYDEGLSILRDWHAANGDRPCRALLLEHSFEVPVGDHVLTCKLDRLEATDSGLEVIDYKLDRELRSQAEVDEDLQLALYALAVSREQGEHPEALSLYFLRHNVVRTTVRTPAQTAELGKWVAASGKDLEAERNWTPCVGSHCTGCDFRSACPAHTDRPMPAPAALPARRQPQLALGLHAAEEPAAEPEQLLLQL